VRCGELRKIAPGKLLRTLLLRSFASFGEAHIGNTYRSLTDKLADEILTDEILCVLTLTKPIVCKRRLHLKIVSYFIVVCVETNCSCLKLCETVQLIFFLMNASLKVRFYIDLRHSKFESVSVSETQ